MHFTKPFWTIFSGGWGVWGRYATREQAEQALAAQKNKTSSMRRILTSYAEGEVWKIEYDGKE